MSKGNGESETAVVAPGHISGEDFSFPEIIIDLQVEAVLRWLCGDKGLTRHRDENAWTEHSGLPLRAKTGHHRTSVRLLAPGLAGARRNPFWVYFWLKLARVRRSKKMAVFFMVEGPIFGRFSPNLDLPS